MLSINRQTESNNVVKQGWLYKRGQPIFSFWKLKWAVVRGEPVPALYLYDQRDHMSPKYIIRLERITLQTAEDDGSSMGSGLLASWMNHISEQSTFLISTRHRKFYLATTTSVNEAEATFKSSNERNSWVSVISRFIEPLEYANLLPQQALHIEYPDTPMLQNTRASGVDDNHDTQSLYSVWSRKSAISSRQSRRSLIGSRQAPGVNLLPSSDNFSPLHSEIDVSPGISNGAILMVENATVLSMEEIQQLIHAHASSTIMSNPTLQSSRPTTSPSDPWDDLYQSSCISPPQTGTPLVLSDGLLNRAATVGSFTDIAIYLARKIIDKYHQPQSASRSHSFSSSASSLNSSIFHANEEYHSPETFAFGNVLLHFAANYDSEEGEEYGKDNQGSIVFPSLVDHEEKQCSNELKAIQSFSTASYLGQVRSQRYVHSALMCLVDYKGFRMVAYARMPLEEETKIFDLNSRESETKRMNHACLKEMNAITRDMGLGEHSVAVSKHQTLQLSFSKTTEIHHNQELGRVYALNLCETFPFDVNEDFLTLGVSSSAKLRPEFVKLYQHSGKINRGLCSNAFANWNATKAASSAKVAKNVQLKAEEAALLRACQYLRQIHIPEFVQKLDSTEVVLVDIRALGRECHSHGINMRYLGTIYSVSRLPHVKDACVCEMIARAGKVIFRRNLRQAVRHFKRTGAVNIDQELQLLAVNFFQRILGGHEERIKIWDESLASMVMRKFQLALDADEFLECGKQALFLSLQHQCGAIFHDSAVFYSRDSPNTGTTALSLTDFSHFFVRHKSVVAENETSILFPSHSPPSHRIPQKARGDNFHHANEMHQAHDDSSLHALAKNLLLNGGRKWCRSEESARLLNLAAKHFLELEQAPIALALVLAAQKLLQHQFSASYALISLTAIEATLAITASSPSTTATPSEFSIIQRYVDALRHFETHLGPHHPSTLTILNAVTLYLCRVGSLEQALMFMQRCVDLSSRVLGQNHAVTGAYLTKAGYLFLSLKRTTEALERLHQSLEIFNSIQRDTESVAGNHYYIAEAYVDLGDIEEALRHCKGALAIRESLTNTESHSKLIESYHQLAKMLTIGVDGVGEGVVVTLSMRKQLEQAIMYYEKVFAHIKNSSEDGKQKLLLNLTRTLIFLKLKLTPTSLLPVLGQARDASTAYAQEMVKDVILKLVHLSPSVYLVDVFHRLESGGDKGAMAEFEIIVQLTERVSLSIE